MRRERIFILLLMAFPLIFLGMIELTLRVLWPQPPRGFSEALFEQRDGHTFLRAGAEGRQSGREFRVEIIGDDRGYRAGLSSPAGSPGGPHIWIFGDSFGFGWGVESHEAASALLLEEGFQITNFCMPGDGLTDYARRMEIAGQSGESPTGILLLLYDNDLAQFLPPGAPTPREDPTHRPWRNRLTQLQIVRLLGRISDGMGVSHWVADRTGYKEQLRGILARDLVIHRRDPGNRGNLSEAMDFLERILVQQVTKDIPVHLVRIVPLYVARPGKINEAIDLLGDREQDYDFDRLDTELNALCKRTGVRYRRFAPTGAEEEQGWYFPHDLHLTPPGHRALARDLAAWIRD